MRSPGPPAISFEDDKVLDGEHGNLQTLWEAETGRAGEHLALPGSRSADHVGLGAGRALEPKEQGNGVIGRPAAPFGVETRRAKSRVELWAGADVSQEGDVFCGAWRSPGGTTASPPINA